MEDNTATHIIEKLKYNLTLQDYEKNLIIELVQNNIEIAKDSKQTSSLIYKKIKENPTKLKCHRCPVPDGILPTGISAMLIDVGIAKNVDIYKKEPWVWKSIPRGMTVMEVTCNMDRSKDFIDVVIYANRKFYNLEDESDAALQTVEHATDIFCMEKLDGDGAHFTIRLINGVFYVIGGSKNVHMVFKNEEDIEKYKKRRYREAREMAKGFLRTLNKMSENQYYALNELLHETKMTVVCEMLQPHNQHVVSFPVIEGEDAEETREGKIYFLMFSQTVTTKEIESLTALPPQLGLTLAKAFSFPTPKYFQSNAKRDLNYLSTQIRKMNRTEGYVLYFIQGNNTIALKKVKTMWNMMLQVLRENSKTPKKKKITTEDKWKTIQARFSERQNKFGFNDDYRKHWEMLAEEFLKYLDNKSPEITRDDMNKRFPSVWSQFLEDTDHSDVFLLIGMQQNQTKRSSIDSIPSNSYQD